MVTSRPKTATMMAATTTAMRKAGHAGRQRWTATIVAMETTATAIVGTLTVASDPHIAVTLGRKAAGSLGTSSPSNSKNLAGDDDHGDAGCEPDRHRIGNVLDEGSEPEQPDRDQDQAGEQRGEHQAIIAFALDDGGDEHDEGAGRAADLEAAAAEQRDEKAADDAGAEPALGPSLDAIAIAMHSGKATTATVRPAMASALRSASP